MGDDSGSRAESAEDSGSAKSRRWLKWIVGGAGAITMFMLTPLAEPVRTAFVAVVGPGISDLVNRGTEAAGVDAVRVEPMYTVETSTQAVSTAIVAGSPSPQDGCRAGDWLRKNGGVPIFTDIVVAVSSPRSDVSLVDVNLKYTKAKSTAKSVSRCIEGGPSEGTTVSYVVSETAAVKRSIGGEGADSSGDRLGLRLETGRQYEVHVSMDVEGGIVVDWTAELAFDVGGTRTLHTLPKAKTSGIPTGVKTFSAEAGVWRPVS
ncbi:hypothetical protein [Kribbella sp. CA-294648]|uniref:hypothetical protein n=1 Tax=Kribbella sp. CA-294648 TaxID=3239948 RepID=UPI003D94D8F9